MREETRIYITKCLEEVKEKGMRKNDLVRCVGKKLYGSEFEDLTTSDDFKKMEKKVSRIVKGCNEIKAKRKKSENGKKIIEAKYWLSEFYPEDEIQKEIEEYQADISKNFKEFGEEWLKMEIKKHVGKFPVINGILYYEVGNSKYLVKME